MSLVQSLTGLTIEDLKIKLAVAKKEYGVTRFHVLSGQEKAVHKLKKLKKTIAVILTLITEKKNSSIEKGKLPKEEGEVEKEVEKKAEETKLKNKESEK